MRVGQVVIGANYGDEGKGLITDFLASSDPHNTLVVRFNGGAQAGHTVVTPDGLRHVFSHFGAASFLSCPTFLSQFFIVNPIMFEQERRSLRQLGVKAKVFISERALLTTPFDVFINQSLERARGGSRHGSCGLGINETVTRCSRHPSLKTVSGDVRDLPRLMQKLEILGRQWLPERLLELGLSTTQPEIQNFLSMKEQILSRFAEDLFVLRESCQITACFPASNHVIFEGAQGLMLDEDRIDQWPYVTRSRTGLTNVLYLARQLNIEHLDVTYVTRSYLTRHGAGPLPGEAQWQLLDETNLPNQFQGTLRFADLDRSQLRQAIGLDLAGARRSGLSIEAALAVTCCDQIQFPAKLDAGIPVGYRSFGPSRTDVERVTSRRPANYRCSLAISG